MSNSEITIKFVFAGDEVHRSIEDNPEVVRAILARCTYPVPNSDMTARLHVGPREDDGRLEWALNVSSANGRRSHSVKQNSFNGEIKLEPL
jgi:hypothetical protein